MPSQRISALTLCLILSACPGEDEKKEDKESTSDSTSNGNSGTEDGEESSGEKTQDKKTGEETKDGESQGEESSSSETAGSESSSGETSGDASQICRDFALKSAECDPEYSADEIEQYCELSLEYYEQEYGEACRSAAEDHFACLSKLDCEEIDTGCTEKFNELDQACDGLRRKKR